MNAHPSAAPRHDPTGGQATVEFALVLPLLIVLGLMLVQVAYVAQTAMHVEAAAQAGARAAAIDPTVVSAEAAARADGRLDGLDAQVRLRLVGSDPELAEVTVEGRVGVRLPLVGGPVRRLTVSSTAVMAVERSR